MLTTEYSTNEKLRNNWEHSTCTNLVPQKEFVNIKFIVYFILSYLNGSLVLIIMIKIIIDCDITRIFMFFSLIAGLSASAAMSGSSSNNNNSSSNNSSGIGGGGMIPPSLLPTSTSTASNNLNSNAMDTTTNTNISNNNCNTNNNNTNNNNNGSASNTNNTNSANSGGEGLKGTGDSPHFCLRWNNHQTNLMGTLSTVMSSEQYADVTIFCEGQYSIIAMLYYFIRVKVQKKSLRDQLTKVQLLYTAKSDTHVFF